MKHFLALDHRESVRKIVKKKLKEEFGIKIPKDKQRSQDEDNSSGKIFGCNLENVPCTNIGTDYYNPIPRFLIESVSFLQPHLKTEGLFRKSGSLTRQKLIRQQLEDGLELDVEMAQPHDIASLMKQFFRELPDPLLSYRLHDSFLKCLHLSTLKERISSVLLLCLLLPDAHLRVLRYMTLFVSEVANHCQGTKMGLGNLAIVLTPNLMFSIKDRSGEKALKEQTQLIELLFRKANDIAIVPDAIVQCAADADCERTNFSASSGDEVDTPRALRQRRARRRRSRSISAFVRRLKHQPVSLESSEKPVVRPVTNHKRSRSDDLILLKEGPKATETDEAVVSGEVRIKADLLCIDANQKISQRLKSLKRKPEKRKPPSPTRKSPRLSTRSESYQNITSPKLVSVPTQYLMTPKHCLQPIQRAPDSGRTSYLEGPLAHTPSMLNSQFLAKLENSSLTPGSNMVSVRKSVKYNIHKNRPIKPQKGNGDSSETGSTTPVLTKENAIPSPSYPSSGASTPKSIRVQGSVLPSTRFPLTPKIDARRLDSWKKKAIGHTLSHPT